MEERLPTHLWVMAQVRRASDQGVPVVVAKKGEKMGGGVLLKVVQGREGARVLTQVRDVNGQLAWMAALSGRLVPEAEAEEYIQRAVKRDPDLWVIEVEDRQGAHHFEGAVLT